MSQKTPPRLAVRVTDELLREISVLAMLNRETIKAMIERLIKQEKERLCNEDETFAKLIEKESKTLLEAS